MWFLGYGVIYTVYGSVFGNTLQFELRKYPTKQHFNQQKTGFIQFIRESNGECNILRVLETPLVK